MQYLRANNFHIPELSIFSGDIWTSEFGWKALEIIYNAIKSGLDIEFITMASNCSFVGDPIAVQKMQQFIDKFNAIGCPFQISISVDGKCVDEAGRPRNDKNNKYTDEFYERIGSFARHNNFLFHPMVSAENVKYWIENYEWWRKFLQYYEFDLDDIMTLEVRNGNWTEENIEDYCKFLTLLLDRWMKDKCHNNPQVFAKYLASSYLLNSENPSVGGYMPWLIGRVDTFIGCTVANHLTVRLGDLAICPCHRTAYNEYLYGYFDVKNDKIVGVRAVNPVMAIKVYMNNVLTSSPLCDQCPINNCCLKGCLGSQFEYGRDPFMPLENICKFFKNKAKTIFKYYRDHKIIDYLKQYGQNEYFSEDIATILRINDELGENFDGLGKI